MLLLAWWLAPVMATQQLRLVSSYIADRFGAFCLDGTRPGYYLAKNDTNNSHWLIYFEGGGWCSHGSGGHMGSCADRAGTYLGSSSLMNETFDFYDTRGGGGGIISGRREHNPTFSSFNRVKVNYCDGGSYSGYLESSKTRTATDGTEVTLYFRGRNIVSAVIAQLLEEGLDKATHVLLSGGSAGGLGAMLQASHVESMLLAAGCSLQKFRVAVLSGFFLLHPSPAEWTVSFPKKMRYVVRTHNISESLDSDCVADNPDETWRCFFANYSYAYSRVPIFLLQSAYDNYQLAHVIPRELSSECTQYCQGLPATCATKDFRGCNSSEIRTINRFGSSMLSDIKGASRKGNWTKKATQPGNGAFIDSCDEHSIATGSEAWLSLKIDGVSMNTAVTNWWLGPTSDTARSHWHEPCRLRESQDPHQCNPTCKTIYESEGDGSNLNKVMW